MSSCRLPGLGRSMGQTRMLQKHSTEIESVVDELTELKSGNYTTVAHSVRSRGLIKRFIPRK
jgi:hypothetical protein